MSLQRSISVKVSNRLGMHARPAMEFVDCASAFAATITVRANGQEVDGKSIMQLMMLAATEGTVLDIRAEGDDADQACAALNRLVEGGFGEE